MIDAWDILEKRIKDAKDKAKETDKALLDASYRRCPECRSVLRPSGLNKMVCSSCGFETLSSKEKVRQALEAGGAMTARELAQNSGVSRQEVSAYLDARFV